MVISNPVTFEYKASKEERRQEETRREEKSLETKLETGLLARLEALGLCKTEERKKLEKARSCSQVRFTLLELLAGSPCAGTCLTGTSSTTCMEPVWNLFDWYYVVLNII